MSDRPRRWKKPIPESIRLWCYARDNGICHLTGEFVRYKDADFDHFPAADHRPWNPKTGDTEPPQLDRDFIFTIRRDRHREKTHGPQLPGKGMMRAQGDNSTSAKLKRLADKHAGCEKPKRSRWPKGGKIRSGGFASSRKYTR